jgi:asparagine synthase (glutamine-hydrolysing)
MCGIAGVLAARPLPTHEAEALGHRMIQTLDHRGPDANGIFADGCVVLGHTRLSIIDLSEAGRQPMIDESGRFVIVYNGEIYNYRELREELEAAGHRFRTATDTEVLLVGYRTWGRAVLQRLNGMWAFAIWDRHTNELFAARDRAGKKPFLYAVDADGAFRFASELKALRALGLTYELDPQAAFDFLTQGTYGHRGAAGFLRGVVQLPAGHCLQARPGAPPSVERYWELPVVRPRDRLPYDDAFRRRFRELLIDAIRLRLRADVPVGTTLSGGLDSSVIALVVDQLTRGAPLHLFTSQYPGSVCDETRYFDAVVERLRAPVVHHAEPAVDAWPATLQRVLDHQEEPFGDTSILAHFALMGAARDAGVPVILSGQGGDELLLGYPSMVNAYLGALLSRGQIARAAREIRHWAAGGGRSLRDVAIASLAHALPRRARDRARRHYVRRWAGVVTPSLLRRVTLDRFEHDRRRTQFDDYRAQIFTRFAIPHLTHYDDRNAMAFAIEGRMPFLDHRLVELMFSAVPQALFHAGMTKRVLREAFGDLLPPIVRDRRDKIGFYTPLARWMRICPGSARS